MSTKVKQRITITFSNITSAPISIGSRIRIEPCCTLIGSSPGTWPIDIGADAIIQGDIPPFEIEIASDMADQIIDAANYGPIFIRCPSIANNEIHGEIQIESFRICAIINPTKITKESYGTKYGTNNGSRTIAAQPSASAGQSIGSWA